MITSPIRPNMHRGVTKGLGGKHCTGVDITFLCFCVIYLPRAYRLGYLEHLHNFFTKRRRSAVIAFLETTGKLRFCFNAFLFCYFVSILFCCTIVLSWTTARNISLSTLFNFFNFFPTLVFRGFKKIIIIIIIIIIGPNLLQSDWGQHCIDSML